MPGEGGNLRANGGFRQVLQNDRLAKETETEKTELSLLVVSSDLPATVAHHIIVVFRETMQVHNCTLARFIGLILGTVPCVQSFVLPQLINPYVPVIPGSDFG